MVVEYVVDGDKAGALEFWSKGTKVRCAVLLVKGHHASEREIFTRQPDGEELSSTERWDLPRPREFELVPDVGERSVDSMLDAVRYGHIEAVAWLVNEWRDSSLAAGDMHPQRPTGHCPLERAQGSLNGLVATDELRYAEAGVAPAAAS